LFKLILTFDFPIAIITLPKLQSSPAIAVFTKGEFAIEKATFFASSRVLALLTDTVINLDAPSPSAATLLNYIFHKY